MKSASYILWELAGRLNDRPQFATPLLIADPVHKQFSIPLDLSCLFCFHRAAEIRRHWKRLFGELVGEMNMPTDRLGSRAEWERHHHELDRIIHQFLAPAADGPAFLWGHQLCWPERSIAKHFLDVQLDEFSHADAIPRDYSWSDVVQLKFHEPGPNARRWNRLYVTPSELLWHEPEGMRAKEVGFTVIQDDRSIDNGRDQSVSCSEQLGIGCARSVYCRPYLELGIHPAMDGITYAITRTGAPDTLIAVPVQFGHGGPRLLDVKHRGKVVVNNIGIIDVQITRLRRLWWRVRDRCQNLPYVDELSLTTHRTTGRVVYLSVHREEFAYREPIGSTVGWLWPWLKHDYGIER